MTKFTDKYVNRKQIVDEGYPVSLRQLVKWHKDGVLVAVIINGKAYYLREDVDQHFINVGERQLNQSNDNTVKVSIRENNYTACPGRPTKKKEVESRKSALARLKGDHQHFFEGSSYALEDDDYDIFD